MTSKNLLAMFTLALGLQWGLAQQSQVYFFDLKEYNEALTLYNNKQYQASQTLFNRVKSKTTDNETLANCDYYVANCAIRLNQRGADKLMEAFVKEHPTSTKRDAAFMDVADYYYQTGKYTYALKWYTKTEPKNLSNKEEERYNFNIGYCLFVSKKYGPAKNYFNQLLTSTAYGSQAKYYIGFMAYEGDDYEEASSYFDQVSDDDRYNKKLSYFQADMNFKLGKFEKAIELAEKQLAKGDRKETSELSKIIGESYFNLGEYQKAIPYLQAYKGKRGKWNNVDFYQLGYAFYKQKDYTNAIAQFNKIVGGKNAVAQNAYYHLGECYLNSDKKQEALNAFRNSSTMDYDKKIQEDAWLNYAKLSYEIGNPYKPVPEVLTTYLETYPESPFNAEINELLISSYITSKNYGAALALLESTNSYENKIAYQKVAFYRAIELFNEGDYRQSNEFFVKSLKDELDLNFTARALYWKAETDYLMNNFDQAVIGFKQFMGNAGASGTEEFKNINYNLGYSYFKQKEYAQASTYLKKFVANNPTDAKRTSDAYLRLGDSNFVQSNYWPAMEAYNKAIEMNAPRSDYAYYQKSISYGFLRRNNDKIKELTRFVNKYPKSTLKDDALYELGNTYVATNKTSKGIEAYDQLINEYRSSSYVSKALLKEGLIYYNAEENERALTKFKRVVRDFPATPEANQAVATARLIYVDLGRVNEYASWVNTLDFVEVSDADLDNTTFEAAEKQYLQNNMDAAIRSLSGYLTSFENGLHSLAANFYLAQAYFSKGQKEKSVSHFRYVIDKSRSKFSEQALARLSQVYLEKSDWNAAKPLLLRLEGEADFPQNITFAQSNLMKANYELKDYSAAVSYAEKVLQNTKIDNQIESDAQVIIARSAIQTGNVAKAKSAYAEVQKIATGSLAAEALYYDAYFKHKEGLHEASNATIQKLVKNYSTYKKFGAKGLILMGKNFYALDDAFQATYVLENVTKSFTAYPDVVAEAEVELKRIKTEEAKRNASVNPDGNK